MELIVVSIGTLSKNPLWNERIQVRTSHATTSLLRTTMGEKDQAEMNLLVDPSLPGSSPDSRLRLRRQGCAGHRAPQRAHPSR